MNTEKQTFIRVNLANGEFEISGSVEFVEKHLDELKGVINKDLIKTLPIPTKYENKNEFQELVHDDTIDKYQKSGIFTIDDEGNVIIHKRIPGKTNAEKTKNIALITLYAKKEKILASDIKEMCKKQSCLDNSNFAAIFTRDFETFMKAGKGQKWTIELTIKGEEDAKKLLDSMLNEK